MSTEWLVVVGVVVVVTFCCKATQYGLLPPVLDRFVLSEYMMTDDWLLYYGGWGVRKKGDCLTLAIVKSTVVWVCVRPSLSLSFVVVTFIICPTSVALPNIWPIRTHTHTHTHRNDRKSPTTPFIVAIFCCLNLVLFFLLLVPPLPAFLQQMLFFIGFTFLVFFLHFIIQFFLSYALNERTMYLFCFLFLKISIEFWVWTAVYDRHFCFVFLHWVARGVEMFGFYLLLLLLLLVFFFNSFIRNNELCRRRCFMDRHSFRNKKNWKFTLLLLWSPNTLTLCETEIKGNKEKL